MFPGAKFRSFVVLAAVLAGKPAAAQQAPIRIEAAPVEITPKFELEGRSNAFEPDAELPAAMASAGGGDTLVDALAYSPDGKSLAVGDRPTRPLCTFLGEAPVNENGGLIRIIDLASRKVSKTIRPVKKPGHAYEIVKLAYTPDGKSLVGFGREDWASEERGREVGYHVTVWDASTGEVRRRIDSAKLDDWAQVTFSPDASTFAAVTGDGLRVWDLATGRLRPVPEGTPQTLAALAFAPDGKTIAVGGMDGEMAICDVVSGRRIAQLPTLRKDGATFEVRSLTFSPDGLTLACEGQRDVKDTQTQSRSFSILSLVDLATRTVRLTIPGSEEPGFWISKFSPDGKTLATFRTRWNSDDSSTLFSLWDLETGKPRVSIQWTRNASKIVYSPDGSLVASANSGWISIRDAKDGLEKARIAQGAHVSTESLLAFSPDGKTLASTNGTFQLWDLTLAMQPPAMGGHRFGITCLAYAPDGKTLASASLDRTVKLWDVATRRNLATLVGHEDEVIRFAYSPDGRLVASVDQGGSVRIWDTSNGVCRATLQGPDQRPDLVAFSPDGKTLGLIASDSSQSTRYCRWDVATHARIDAPKLSSPTFRPAAFSMDGGLVVLCNSSWIGVRDGVTGARKGALVGSNGGVGLLVSRDAAEMVEITSDDSLILHREVDGQRRQEKLFTSKGDLFAIGGPHDVGARMAMTIDGRRLVAKLDESLRVFDLTTRRQVGTIPTDEDHPTWLAISPDGKTLASGGSDGDILLHDLGGVGAPAGNR